MKTVLFDRATRKVTGVDRAPLPFEATIYLPYDITIQKTVYTDIPGTKVHKRDNEGNLLYLDNLVVDNDGNLISADEVTYSHKEVDGKIVELYPATEPMKKADTYKFEDNPYIFTADEVIEAKKKAIDDHELADLVFFDENLDEGNFSTELTSFEADMGAGFIAIHPGGEARTKKLSLGTASEVINIYFEGAPEIVIEVGATASEFVPVVNGVAQLSEPASEVYVKFKNPSDQKREVHAFGILI